MKFDPKKLNALSVRLHGKQIGVITRLAGDRQLFAFEQDYMHVGHKPASAALEREAQGRALRVVGFSAVRLKIPGVLHQLRSKADFAVLPAKQFDECAIVSALRDDSDFADSEPAIAGGAAL
jgi:hypothetical protein